MSVLPVSAKGKPGVRPAAPRSPAFTYLADMALEQRSDSRVSSSTMVRRIGILIFAAAFVAASGNSTLRAATWILCAGSQGHLAIETIGGCCLPEASAAQTPTSLSWVAQECGPCTDYPIAIAAGATTSRSQSPSLVVVVSAQARIIDFYAPPRDLPVPSECPVACPPSHLASPAPLRC